MATNYYIAKVYRQHNSLVITVPVPVTIALGIAKGNHVVFTWNQVNCEFDFAKYKPEGAIENGDTKNTVVENRGGST